MINSPKVTYDGKVWDTFVNKMADILQTFVNASPCSTYFTVWFKFELYFFLKVQLTSCQQQIYSIGSHQIICKQLPEQWWTNSLRHICISGITIWMQKSTCICPESKNTIEFEYTRTFAHLHRLYLQMKYSILHMHYSNLSMLLSITKTTMCLSFFDAIFLVHNGLLSDMYLHPFII